MSWTEFTFTSQQWFPRKPEEVFQFFADARNLQAITPEWLQFEILTPGELAVKPGLLINYRLRVHGFPLRWQTEITVWEPPYRFVDEQRRGPYRQWTHEHRFTSLDGGVEVVDFVRYRPPGGWLINQLFVRRDIEAIFAYRRQKLEAFFGSGADRTSRAPDRG